MGAVSVLNIILIIAILYVVSIESTKIRDIEVAAADVSQSVDQISVAIEPSAAIRMSKKYSHDTNTRLKTIQAEIKDVNDTSSFVKPTATMVNNLKTDDQYIQTTLNSMTMATKSIEKQVNGLIDKQPTRATYTYVPMPYRSAMLPPIVAPTAAAPAGTPLAPSPAMVKLTMYPETFPLPNLPPYAPLPSKTKVESDVKGYVDNLYSTLLTSISENYNNYLNFYNSTQTQFANTSDVGAKFTYVKSVGDKELSFNDKFKDLINNYNKHAIPYGYISLSTNPQFAYPPELYKSPVSAAPPTSSSMYATAMAPVRMTNNVPSGAMISITSMSALSPAPMSALSPAPTASPFSDMIQPQTFPSKPPSSVPDNTAVTKAFSNCIARITNYYNAYAMKYNNIIIQYNAGTISQGAVLIMSDTLTAYNQTYLYQYAQAIDEYNLIIAAYPGFSTLNRDATLPLVNSSSMTTYSLIIYSPSSSDNGVSGNASAALNNPSPSANIVKPVMNIVLSDALTKNYTYITRTPGVAWDGITPVSLSVSVMCPVSSSDPTKPALSTGSLPVGSVVSIVSASKIIGASGMGGQPTKNGGNGGVALSISLPIKLTNNGTIAGGGGGGGGGIDQDVGGNGQGGMIIPVNNKIINETVQPMTTGGPGGMYATGGSAAIRGGAGGSGGAAIALNNNSITYINKGIIVGSITP